MKTYFFSGHISRAYGGQITHEFSGLTQAHDAIKAFNDAYNKQLRDLEQQGGSLRSHAIVMDAFNLVEGV